MLPRNACTQVWTSSISILHNNRIGAIGDHQCEDEEKIPLMKEEEYNEGDNFLFRSEDYENSNGNDNQGDDEVLEFDDSHFNEYSDASSEEIDSDTQT